MMGQWRRLHDFGSTKSRAVEKLGLVVQFGVETLTVRWTDGPQGGLWKKTNIALPRRAIVVRPLLLLLLHF